MAAAAAYPAAPPPLPPVPGALPGGWGPCLLIPALLDGSLAGPPDDDDPPDDGQPAGRPPARELFRAGRWDRSSGDGAGFACGGVVDRLPPGATLAGLAGDAWERGLERLSDDELIGVLRAARRLAS